MTRERDRIQENANRYIVRNCPSCTKQDDCIAMYLRTSIECKDRNDCVIKQVIEVCKEEAVINYPKREKEFIIVNGYQAILNMFDTQEINK